MRADRLNADQAYARAEELIAQAQAEEWAELVLAGGSRGNFEALKRLPPNIAELSKLRSLTINHTLVVELSALTSLIGLTRLSASNTPIHDLAPIATLANLESLSLSHTEVHDIRALADMPALRYLDLDHTCVEDLIPLSGAGSLEVLFLNSTRVEDIAPLEELGKLEQLELSDTKVTDLRPIGHLPSLATGHLSYHGTPVISSDPRLEELSKIDDANNRTIQTLAYYSGLQDNWPPVPDKPPTSEVPRPELRPTVSQLRAELEASRPLIRDRAVFALELVQMELAAHRVQPIPNEPEQLEAYRAKTTFLETMLAATTSVSQAIPDDLGAPLSDVEIRTLRDRLQALAQAVHNSIAYLDQHNGTYGALWKIGLIFSIGSLISLFPGIGFAGGAAVAAGPIGIQTFRLIIENKRG